MTITQSEVAVIEAPESPLAVALETRELGALPVSKAEQIRAVFLPMAAAVEAYEHEYNAVMAEAAEAVTPEVSKRARKLRLAIAKVRIDAEKARRDIKEEYLLAGRAIDGTNNVLKWAISQKEEALESIEKHAERMEEERRQTLHEARVEALLPLVVDLPEYDLSQMADDVWDAYLASRKRDHEDRLAAEAKAEAERVERARVEALRVERDRALAPYSDFLPEDLDFDGLGAMPEDVYLALLTSVAEVKVAHEAEAARIRAEAERLAREAAEREAERQAELARIEAERAAERAGREADAKAAEEARRAELAAIEAERQKEREAAEAERVRLAALEAAERERKAREEAEAKVRAEAEARAAKAPTRKRLSTWVDSFALPDLPGEDNETATEIRMKFVAFQAWAKNRIEVL